MDFSTVCAINNDTVLQRRLRQKIVDEQFKALGLWTEVVEVVTAPGDIMSRILVDIELLDSNDLDKIEKRISILQKRRANSEKIKQYSRELAPYIETFNVYHTEDEDPAAGNGKTEYEIVFKSRHVLVLRFQFTYTQTENGWLIKGMGQNKLQNTILLFNPAQSDNPAARGSKESELVSFDHDQLLQTCDKILKFNQCNENPDKLFLFIKKMITNNGPESAYVADSFSKKALQVI